MKTVGTFAAMVVFVIACSHLEATPRLKEAQAAYAKAEQGPAAQYSPAELATAKKFLDQANAALETGDAQVVDDRASIALDKIYTAEAIGRGQEANAQRDAALKELNISRDQLLSQTQQQLGKERAARNDAEAQLAKSRQELEHYAQVRELARGTVITLAGGVLFETGKAELLPGAQDRLARVADFLKNSDRSVVVEGYTDSTGSEATNMALSERRAQTVRDYLASHGVPAGSTQGRRQRRECAGGQQRHRLGALDEPPGADRPRARSNGCRHRTGARRRRQFRDSAGSIGDPATADSTAQHAREATRKRPLTHLPRPLWWDRYALRAQAPHPPE